jgi:hypothetical protein
LVTAYARRVGNVLLKAHSVVEERKSIIKHNRILLIHLENPKRGGLIHALGAPR